MSPSLPTTLRALLSTTLRALLPTTLRVSFPQSIALLSFIDYDDAAKRGDPFLRFLLSSLATNPLSADLPSRVRRLATHRAPVLPHTTLSPSSTSKPPSSIMPPSPCCHCGGCAYVMSWIVNYWIQLVPPLFFHIVLSVPSSQCNVLWYLLPLFGWLFDIGAGACEWVMVIGLAFAFFFFGNGSFIQKQQTERCSCPVQLSKFLGRDNEDGVRRSAISGKKVLLKLDKSKEDKMAESNRNELLKFLNASYD
ncbi:hypothetical protein ZIOFF_017327 [Zingiber officinale]|uniref:Uncharacterized protein n=1 Tax=Zingiber officinale TaxID=94328 RepID=A0A8J5LA61_ZINOF|nr:hypothetical protein ZIOFF_017327 [Zingiber officinale]